MSRKGNHIQTALLCGGIFSLVIGGLLGGHTTKANGALMLLGFLLIGVSIGWCIHEKRQGGEG